MGYFKNVKFEKTRDNSVGLYDKEAGDILHSNTGALKEANDKFINPLIRLMSNLPDEINILDICYGVGYNSKAAVKLLNEKNVKIDALECNKEFIFLSPFINDGIEDDELKIFILSEILKTVEKKEEIGLVLCEFLKEEYQNYNAAFTRRFMASFDFDIYKSIPLNNQQGLLHNIYYEYISSNMKNSLKCNRYKNCSIDFFLGDARKSVFKTSNKYDIVFLDAYSPQKDPTLWTIDFLSVVKSKMKNNSVLLSYSKSSPFRSALIELGFNVGKTIIDNNETGTIASFNSSFIFNKLSPSDIEILNTRSGIPYRDVYLNLPSSSIIINRSIEGGVSNRISRTQFEKSVK